jgi:hypothetical protein
MMYSTMSAMPQSAKPVTAPARNAVLKAPFQPTAPSGIADTAVRALENTATFMPIQPESTDVEPPMKKMSDEKPPSAHRKSPVWPSFDPTCDTRMRMTMPKKKRKTNTILYSAMRNASAPARTALYTSSSTSWAVFVFTSPSSTFCSVEWSTDTFTAPRPHDDRLKLHTHTHTHTAHSTQTHVSSVDG